MEMICFRAQDRLQLYNANGDVRLCSWMDDQYVGNLLDNTIEEVYCGERAKRVKERHASGDYSLCNKDQCPYVACGTQDSVLVPYERERTLPKQLCIGFERVCNYACPSCLVHQNMIDNAKCDLEHNYEIIEKRVRDVMNFIPEISANGCGELFVSKRTLGILADWRPYEQSDKCKVILETNGSLFDKSHWEQIENLGQYYLDVCVTVMSFNEQVYQYLSGCNLPIEQITDNLRFVSELRRKNVINNFQIGTVVQEQNFREMPLFVKRCIEEFEADDVRLRPYEPWGAESRDVAWFKDVRVSDHPLHLEYRRIMEDPIFKHAKCSEGSGGLNAQWTDNSPFKMELMNQDIMAKVVMHPEMLKERIEKACGGKPVVVYGFEPIGQVVSKVLIETDCKIDYIIAYKSKEKYLLGKRVIDLSDITENESRNVVVIITPMHAKRKIQNELNWKGYMDTILITDLLNENK